MNEAPALTGASSTETTVDDTATAFLRARSPEQREVRRRTILAAAETLLETHPVGDISLRELARTAELSKTNVTRYFATREAVFFALLNERFAAWIDELTASGVGAGRYDAVAKHVGESLAAQSTLCKLWASLGNELERNIPADAIVAFKTEHTRNQVALATWVVQRLPTLDEDAAREWVQMLILLVAGLWPFAHPSPALAETLVRPEHASLRVDFPKRLSRALTVSLLGIVAARTT